MISLPTPITGIIFVVTVILYDVIIIVFKSLLCVQS